MSHCKPLGTALICLSLLCLPGCHGADAASLPEHFHVGEDTAPALQLEEGVLAEATQPAEGEEGPYTYRYEELPDAGALVEEYSSLLTQEENGFSLAEESEEAPDFTQAEGSVTLAKSSTQEGRMFQIDLTWSEGTCTVSVSTPEAEATDPLDPMTMRDAVEYLQSLPPARLGLDEDTPLTDYVIYPQLGSVLVDGSACLVLDLYRNTEQGSHNIVTSYLVSGDRQRVYSFDRATRVAKEL